MLPTDDGTTGFGVTQVVRHHWLARSTSRHDRNACYDLNETAATAFWHSLATKRVRPPGLIRFGLRAFCSRPCLTCPFSRYELLPGFPVNRPSRSSA